MKTCCCGHDASMHLGGADLKAGELVRLQHANPQGDGGMCRATVNGARCSCFNFCDCYKVVA